MRIPALIAGPLALLALAGTAVAQTYGPPPPPPGYDEARPPHPPFAAAWVPAHYRWTPGGYRWVPGHWVTGQRGHFVPGHWSPRGWIPEHWVP